MSYITHPDLDTSVSLRVHFRIHSNKSYANIRDHLKDLSKIKPQKFTLKIVDQHIWLGIPKKNQKMYSPNLHLEFTEETSKTSINAKFGPDPALWTLFMFLHFGLAIGMITTFVFLYANSVLNKTYQLQISILVLLSCIWIALYFFARYNRNRGKTQARQLLGCVKEVID